MKTYTSWVHGHNVSLERKDAWNATGKSSVKSVFKGDPGDIVDLGGYASVACLRIGWAARFVVYDSGKENFVKSGEFWCHYAIPTFPFIDGKRAAADSVMINYDSTNVNALKIAAVHVWDGNKRIHASDNLLTSADGGIPGHSFEPSMNPNLSLLVVSNFDKRPIFFGIGVSLLIRAQQAKDDFLEIRGVGTTFQVP